MSPRILYIQGVHPVQSETFVRAEINSLFRRGYDVWVAVNRLDNSLLSECEYRDRIVRFANEGQTLHDVVSRIRPHYIHSHFITESARIASAIARDLGIPFGTTVHAYDIWKRNSRIEPEEIAQLAAWPEFVTCAVEGTRHRDYMLCCGVSDEKIVVTPNTVSKSALPKRRESPPSRALNLLMVGRAVAKKGFLVAIDAVRLLRLSGYQATLHIIGGGDSSRPLGKVIQTIADTVPFIHAQPMRSHSETLEAIKSADALIMPCIIAEDGDSDGIPTVLMEAMLLGVPVIATDVGSITDLVRDGETGLIARSGDPSSLACQIRRLDSILSDKCERDELLDRAYNEASSKEIESSVDALIGHLRKVLPNVFLQTDTENPNNSTRCQANAGHSLHAKYGASMEEKDAYNNINDFADGVPKAILPAIATGKHYCPICETESKDFLPYGVVPRPHAMCPNCKSLERHRFIWLFLKSRTNLLHAHGARFLHIAPEPFFENLFKPVIGPGYLTADLNNPKAMMKMDITDINFADETFDMIYCSHVLEHVPDDRRAMRELRRVLKKGGWTAIMVPVSGDVTREDLSITDPKVRERLYGQSDHVRYYGSDVKNRLKDAGFSVDVVESSAMLDWKDHERMCLGKEVQEMFFCTT